MKLKIPVQEDNGARDLFRNISPAILGIALSFTGGILGGMIAPGGECPGALAGGMGTLIIVRALNALPKK